MSVSIRAVTAGIDAMAGAPARARRQREYAARAALLMRGYVPMLEGTLRQSEPVNSDYGRGILTWNTPYAARQYYEPHAHTQPQATDHWDEACMRDHGDELREYARGLFLES